MEDAVFQVDMFPVQSEHFFNLQAGAHGHHHHAAMQVRKLPCQGLVLSHRQRQLFSLAALDVPGFSECCFQLLIPGDQADALELDPCRLEDSYLTLVNPYMEERRHSQEAIDDEAAIDGSQPGV